MGDFVRLSAQHTWAIQLICLLPACLLLAADCAEESDGPAAPQPEFVLHTTTVYSDQYLRNRFFRLQSGLEEQPLEPGQRIDPASILVYRALYPWEESSPWEVQGIAVFIDSLGVSQEQQAYASSLRWEELDFDLQFDVDGRVTGLDLGAGQTHDADLLAVVYLVVDQSGFPVFWMGDRPGTHDPTHAIPGDPEHLYYFMKLLKAPVDDRERWSFPLMRRNVYDLGGRNLDHTSLQVTMARNTAGAGTDADEWGLPYLQLFGLDRYANANGSPGADGLADLPRQDVFDLRRGLLYFPAALPEPFNGTREQYEAFAAGAEHWQWDEGGFLATHRAPGLYSPEVLPSSYPQYRHFRLVVTTLVPAQ